MNGSPGASGDASEVALPDARKVLSPDPHQAATLWEDITDNELYRKGVSGLAAGDVVFDVGANIGLAALFFTGLVPGLRVFAFEPAEDCFSCLRENVARHGPGITPVQAALGAEPGVRDLTYYPRSPAQSSFYPDAEEDRRNTSVYLANAGFDEELARAFLPAMHQGRSYPVRVTTVSAALDEHGVEEIALLKIDVERAEQDVLDGVGEAAWPRVRRVVAEIHDTDGRLASVAEQLTGRGFHVETGQEALLAGTNVHMLYAARDH